MRDDLRARYGDERLPRYTSYPTSPHFSDAVQGETYSGWLGSLSPERRLSLYLHVPFCRAMCWYCGCHTSVTRRDEPIAEYLAALRAEIGLVADRIGSPGPVGHIHFGGGTPTIMPPADFVDLIALLRARFGLEEDAEVAIEIDPRTLTVEMMFALASAGVTRASLGVQSFDPAVQAAIRRVQSFAETERAASGLRRAGIRALNLDLIYGLPLQDVASCRETVRRSLELRPDRLSVFGYAHVPFFKKHQRKIEEAALPDGPAREAQAEAIAEELVAAGYRRIGLDHYARPDDPMALAHQNGTLRRNFQGYTTDDAEALVGFGASAIGRLPQGYVQNEVVTSRYVERVRSGVLATAKGYRLTPEDALRAEAIERIMCDGEIDLDRLCRAHGRTAEGFLATLPKLRALEADGLVRIRGPVVQVEEQGRLLVRAVASAFDAYLGQSGRTHSRAV